MEIERKRRERRNLIVLTGAAAVLAVAVNFAFTALNTHIKNRKKKGVAMFFISRIVLGDVYVVFNGVVPGSNVRINLSAPEILRLADHIVAKSKEVHDAVASVPLDKVTYANTILPLVELEAQQFPLIQSCAFPKLVSASEDIRKASTEAERRIDAHVSGCSKREDVYRVIKAFTARGDWMSSEVKRFAQYLVQDFERNGLNLTSTKREELQRLRAQIDELSMRYIRNLNDDNTFLLFHDMELVGLPPEFLKVSLEKTENGKFKVMLRSHHVSPILELCKVGSTRKSVAVDYGRRCEVNLSVLEKLIQLRHKLARLLGYSNYAEYAIDRRMAKSSTKVFEFLEKISGSLTESASKELSLLKEMKIPVALLISQLQKEVDGHPGLLRFSEVVNLLHEFGHVVHHICNRAPFARFSGLRLDPDFVEIPSVLLEKWCYESSSLKLISGFHQDITKPIDDEMCKSLKRWWSSFSALKLKQEILYCLFDQIIHSTENVDMIGLFKHLHSKVMLGLPMLEGTNPASCFPRTAIGYEATCYSRIWSEVFAADIFSMKFRDDIFNQNAGIHFRNKVLAPGGAKDPLEILSDFLGREPSIQAFVDSKAHSV
ncbi:UNVERIFIED_CONTAM: putative thimet oligopeptidase [Sesamum radiatum]|uniref:Thimet oligopeptidase n=1 Tax=Sesamum radiatum TaxID=300843 RepID=A0AAW2S102_SESRA